MKKNLRKIPEEIRAKVKSIKEDDIVVGCAVKFKSNDILAGRLKHLGVSLTSDGLLLPDAVVPPVSQGKYSDRNVNGLEIVRNDLPLETHYNTVETPNWGDFRFDPVQRFSKAEPLVKGHICREAKGKCLFLMDVRT